MPPAYFLILLLVLVVCALLLQLYLHKVPTSPARGQSSEQKPYALSAALQNIALIVTDAHGYIRELNPGAEHTFGCSAHEVIGQAASGIFPSHASTWFKETFETLKQQKEGESQGMCLPFRSQEMLFALYILYPLFDQSGCFAGSLGVVMNVGEYKRTGEAERMSEEFHRTVIENSPVGISVRSRTGRLLSYNPAWQRIWAIPEEAIQADMRCERQALLFDERDRYLDSNLGEVERVYKQGGSLFLPELKTRHARLGAAEWVSQYFYAIKNADGEVERVVIMTEDITERRRMVEALRQSQMEYQKLVENLGEGVCVVDPNERFVFANRAAEEIFGMAPGSLVNRVISDFTTAEQFALIQDQTSRRRQGMKSGYEIEITRPDGEKRNVWVAATPHFDPNGRFSGAFAVLRDNTEQKRAGQAEHEARTLAEALRDTAAAVNSTLQLNEVIQQIIANAGRVVPHDAANLLLIKPDGMSTLIFRSEGYLPLSPDTGDTLVGVDLKNIPSFQRILETRRPLIIGDVGNFPDWKLVPESGWVQSYLGAPLLSKGKVIGFLNLDSATPHFFSEIHAERLQAFATQAAIAVENAQLYAELQQQAAENTALYRASSRLLKPVSNILALTQQIAQTVKDELGIVNCGVLLVDESRGVLKRAARYGDFEVNTPQEMALNGRGLSVLAAKCQQVIYSPDVTQDVHYLPGAANTCSELAVPLFGRENVIGVLDLQSPYPDAFDERARRMVTAFAEGAGLALENARLQAELQRQAIMDELTGIYNYRGLMELGNREVERAHRFQRPLAAIFFDIDHFRLFNNRYGHPIGNLVLRAAAECSHASVRAIDIVTRYGGEEFVILLPENDLLAALPVAERLRQEIAAMQVPTEYGPLSVTISAGVAELTDEMPDLESLIEHANRAEHLAKERGRNRIES